MYHQLYKSTLFLTLILSLSFSPVHAQDIDIDIEHFVTSSQGLVSGGTIQLDFIPAVYPVEIDWMGPCDDPDPIIIPADIFNVNARDLNDGTPCPGEYCFNLIANVGSNNECCTTFCVDVKSCEGVLVQSGSGLPYYTFVCKTVKEKENFDSGDDGMIYLTGESNISTDRQSIEMSYHTYTSAKNDWYAKTSNKINATMASVSEQILNKGYSNYDIAVQSEIKTNEPFVFKFNKEGEIVWVKHNQSPSKELRELTSEISLEKEFSEEVLTKSQLVIKPSYALEKVYPNPFKNELNMVLYSNSELELDVHLINSVGKTVQLNRTSLVEGENKFTLNIDQTIAHGMYFLFLKDKYGNTIVEKVMHFDNY